MEVAYVPSDNTTLEQVLAAYASEDFGGSMVFVGEDELRCTTCRTVSPANTLTFTSMRRMEGASDPADMLAVVAVRCPACSTGATLVLHYGPTASLEEASILRLIDAA
jgi:hypothetical protein